MGIWRDFRVQECAPRVGWRVRWRDGDGVDAWMGKGRKDE